MKEWLQDKKNQPVVIGLSVVVLIGVVVAALFEFGVIGGQSQTPQVAATYNSPVAPGSTGPSAGPAGGPPPAPGKAPSPGAPPARPAMAANPGAGKMAARNAMAKAAAPKTVVVAAKPVVHRAAPPSGKADPFLPGYAVAALLAPPPDVKAIASISSLTNFLPALPTATANDGGGVSPTPQPIAIPANMGVVSGIINTNGIHAIYEANGNATIVQPGDELPDGLGKVVSIQANSMTVHLAAADRDVDVPITQGETPAVPVASNTGAPNGPNGGNGFQGQPNFPNNPNQGNGDR